MTSVCISKCVNDTRDPRMPVRATYVNLYKWPESDAEFVKSVTANVRRGMHALGHPRVVDSISCRQMFLRSYTFSRQETVPEKTSKCFGRVKDKVSSNDGRKRKETKGSSKRRFLVVRKVKEISRSALFRIFHRLLSCAASVDVVDQKE
ncbi:hypothetical protein CFOL_v3_08502 [Cephalotus follicularis]|uniref:Uncharacterized protein n=1 Tax=Cephalotus follicularis TaxID=3775 RepID=A0A1Q3BAC1_CEPFO|nr:hypothetical protein CFOL_v3_08502 [Cephalotus follicularis]